MPMRYLAAEDIQHDWKGLHIQARIKKTLFCRCSLTRNLGRAYMNFYNTKVLKII